LPLTVKQVESAKPGRHSDGKGLYLLVKPKPDAPDKGGAKSWVLRVQHRGQRRDFGIGSYASESFSPDYERFPLVQRRAITLAEARDKARVGRELAKVGIDPSAEWRREEMVIPTFEMAARQYHAHVEKAWRNGKHGAQWLTTLETYAFPTIGPKLVSEIDASDIQAVLLPIWLTKSETARRVRQRVLVVLDYCKGKGWRETEAPARALGQLMKGIKQPKKGNFEALPYAELPALMGRLRDGDLSVGRLALQFLILNASRSGEVRGATWGEIDWDAAEWRIPPERMKADKLHIVPLVPAAIEILEQMRGLFGDRKPSEPIFPGIRGKSLSDATLAKVLRVAGSGTATVHGLRSTFRDWAAETGFADAWAEAALAHGQSDKTIAAYKRTTFFAQRRDKLMPAWSRYALSDRSNVIAMAAAT
jgi:integrase